MKILIKNFHKVVNGLKVVEVVITDIDADAEVETSIASVDNLEVSKLYKVCVLCISHSHNWKNIKKLKKVLGKLQKYQMHSPA